jgi:hypothetical protein
VKIAKKKEKLRAKLAKLEGGAAAGGGKATAAAAEEED